MSDRLSDYDIEILAEHSTDPTSRVLAREVQEYRLRAAGPCFSPGCPDHDDPIRNLCARHGITVEGIVALVDEVMGELDDTFPFSPGFLRRLARGEEA